MEGVGGRWSKNFPGSGGALSATLPGIGGGRGCSNCPGVGGFGGNGGGTKGVPEDLYICSFGGRVGAVVDDCLESDHLS